MHKLILIAPDKAAGEAFTEVVNHKLLPKGFEIKTYYASISPRVETDDQGKGKLTSEPEKVSSDLAQVIKKAIMENGKDCLISITCNTLSLENAFVKRTREILEADGFRAGVDYHLITTIEVLKEKYLKERVAPPLVLGTKVLSGELPKEGFKTLLSENHEDMADLVQEIIWRVKTVEGSDISTAPAIDNLADTEALKGRVKELNIKLRNAGINRIILGCTELPIAFDKHADKNDLAGMEIIDPAEVVAEKITNYK